MPFTPFHFGPALAVSIPLRRRIDPAAFVLANVAVDTEPLAVMALGLDYPLHGYLHTLLGDIAAACALAFFMYVLRSPFAKVMAAVRLPGPSGWGRTLLSSLLGVWFHVLTDALIYAEMKPFFPLSGNPLYGFIISDELYPACAAAFIPAGFIYFLSRDGRPASTGR